MIQQWVQNLHRWYWESIADILVAKNQTTYKWIHGPIVFILLWPTSQDKERIIEWGKDKFYKTKWEQIARIVKYQTWEILDWNSSIMFSDSYRDDHEYAMNVIADWISVTNPRHIRTQYLRKNLESRHKAYSAQLAIECKAIISEDVKAILVMTHKRNYWRTAVSFGFNHIVGCNKPYQLINKKDLDENQLFYFPFNP